MVSLVVGLVLAQAVSAPPGEGVAVVFSRKEGVSVQEAQLLSERFTKHLFQAGMKRVLGPAEVAAGPQGKAIRACGTKASCLATAGKKLGVWAVAQLQQAKVVDDLAVVLELVSTETGRRLFQRSLVLPARSPEWEGRLRELAEAVVSRHPAQAPPEPPPVVQPDRPVVQQPLPVPHVEPPRVVVDTQPPRTAVYASGAGAALAAAGAIALFAWGNANHRDYVQNVAEKAPPISWTWSQAETAARNANAGYTGAILSGAASVALTALTLHLAFNQGVAAPSR